MATRPLYSSLLYGSAPASTGTYESDPVPDGYVWVVREVELLLDQVLAVGWHGMRLTDDSGWPIFSVAGNEAMPQRAYHLSTRQVLMAGEFLIAELADDNWTWRVSGYVLTAP